MVNQVLLEHILIYLVNFAAVEWNSHKVVTETIYPQKLEYSLAGPQ
jgi:hypothetical protein